MNSNFVYPITPENVPLSVTEPTARFKKSVTTVLGSIIFFFITYLLLFILSLGLVVGCFYAGIAIITAGVHLLLIIAGVGLMGVGVMIFIFLIKFIFAVSKYDRSGIIEITEAEQPALFAFIRQLTTETHTPFPKKIFVSADVNACVFYDSSFWSMFFPIKKNLQIGLGLVNSVNVSEFKAVMAHEFGHFSQRSMKLGSFVYQVNMIIYNMLFQNKGYGDFLQGWANIHGIFSFFASITAKIANGIQWILRQLYGVINKSYLHLSREMEFHADAVAATVSGSKSLGTALKRIELASSCYDIALQKCDEFYKQNKLSSNIYPQQKLILQKIAADHKLPMQNGLPQITDEFYKNNNTSRINFKDQWASHPSTEERIAHLDDLAIPAEIMDETAWVIFNNKEELQKQLTQKIYETITIPQGAGMVDEKEFENKLDEDEKRYSFPEVYNGFYDNRQIKIMEDEELDVTTTETALTFTDLFTPENAALSKKINATANDIELVKAIGHKRIDTKSFDFDGTKYKRSQAPEVANKLETELSEVKSNLERIDRQAVQFFIAKSHEVSNSEADELKASYKSYFHLRKKADEFLLQMNGMLEVLGPIFSGQTLQIENINSIIGQLKRDHEPIFKQKLQYWISQNVFNESPELITKATNFINADYVYFGGSSFFETELNDLHSLCNESWAALNNYIFMQFKAILEKQLKYAHQ